MTSDSMPDTRGVTVTGTGAAAVPVDQVTVTIGIFETRSDPGEAFQAAAETATRVLAILADDGADSRSVRTADLTLGPQIEWVDGKERLRGYQAGQRLVVQLSGLSRVGRMLTDVVTQAGGPVRIESFALTPSDSGRALAQAREAAMADARAKAEQLAGLVGRELGEVLWIDEQAGDTGRPVAVAARGYAKESMDMPIAGGDSTVASAVTVRWGLR